MHAACQGVSLAACTITLPRFKLEVLADSVHHFVMSVSSICICRMPSLSPTLTTGPSPSDPTTSVRTDCPETSQRMSTAWWLEGNIYNAIFGPQPWKVTCGFHNTLHWTFLKLSSKSNIYYYVYFLIIYWLIVSENR